MRIRRVGCLTLLCCLCGHSTGNAEEEAKGIAQYEMLVTIDPGRALLRGEIVYDFKSMENARFSPPLALDPAFRVTESGWGESGAARTKRMDPRESFKWEGWPLVVSPEASFLTHITQDHLLLGPLFFWYPAVVSERIAASGSVSISRPEQYSVATDGSLTSEEKKLGYCKSTFSFGGLNPRPTLLVLSRYPAKEIESGGRVLRFVISPSPGSPSDSLVAMIGTILSNYETWFGAYRYPTLTVVEAPQVSQENVAFGRTIVGMAFKGLLLLPREEFEGHPDEHLLAHELAHQWWGTLVGAMPEDDHGSIWITEAMAEFSSLLQVEKAGGRAGRSRLLADWERGARVIIEKHGDKPLYKVAENASDDARLGLIYSKGPYVIEMIRQRLGNELFLRTLAEIVKRWGGMRMGTREFEQDLSTLTEQDWRPFFDRWVRGKGLPSVKVTYCADRTGDGAWGVRIRVDQQAPCFEMNVPMRVHYASGASDVRAVLTGSKHWLEMTVPQEPSALTVDPDHGVLLGEVTVVRVGPLEIDN